MPGASPTAFGTTSTFAHAFNARFVAELLARRRVRLERQHAARPVERGGHRVEPDVGSDVHEVAVAEVPAHEVELAPVVEPEEEVALERLAQVELQAEAARKATRSPSPRPAPGGSGAAGPSRGSRRGGRSGRGNAPAQTEANLTRRDRGSLHVRRPAGGHRPGLPRRRRDDDRRRREPARARAVPRRRLRARPAGRRLRYVPALRELVERHDVEADRPAHRPRPARARARPRPAARARAAPRGRRRRAARRQVPRARPARGARARLAADVAADRGAGRPALPRAREGAPRLRLAAHLPLRERERARVLPPLHAGRVVRAAVLPRRGVLDRRLLRLGRPLPERDPAHDDRVEGRRVDQGADDQGLAADRVRLPRRRDARPRRAGEHPVLPGERRHALRHRHQPALRRRVPAARRPPAAATRSSRSRSPAASGPSRASASSARAS